MSPPFSFNLYVTLLCLKLWKTTGGRLYSSISLFSCLRIAPVPTGFPNVVIEKVIADSFDGRTLHQNFAENLLKEREYAKHDTYAKQFYEWCQGEDWETVVDLNTQALLECAKKKLVKHGNIHTFDTGGHPAIATNAEKFADIVLAFLND